MEEIEELKERIEELEDEVKELREENENLVSFVDAVKDGLRWV